MSRKRQRFQRIGVVAKVGSREAVHTAHELAEWLNDPFVNNVVPLWEYPPLNVTCGDNPFLEVGDPQGNGPQFDSFPTVPIALNGYTYHLQDLVMLPWFAHETPSSAQNGWYDYPDTRQITTPAVKCP